jgi:hypothetical protein
MQISQKQAKPDFSQALDYTCDKCGGTAFVAQYLIKKFSALLSPTGEEMLAPIQVFACAKCGHINNDFLPESDQVAAL